MKNMKYPVTGPLAPGQRAAMDQCVAEAQKLSQQLFEAGLLVTYHEMDKVIKKIGYEMGKRVEATLKEEKKAEAARKKDLRAADRKFGWRG